MCTRSKACSVNRCSTKSGCNVCATGGGCNVCAITKLPQKKNSRKIATYVPLEADATVSNVCATTKLRSNERWVCFCAISLQYKCPSQVLLELRAASRWMKRYVQLLNCVPTRGGCAVCAVCAILIALITTEVPLQGLMELVDLDACLRMPVPR